MYRDDETLHHTIIDWRQNITGKAELDTHTLCAAIGRESWYVGRVPLGWLR